MNGTEALDGVKCVGSARVNASNFQGFALLFLSIFPLSPLLPCKAHQPSYSITSFWLTFTSWSSSDLPSGLTKARSF